MVHGFLSPCPFGVVSLYLSNSIESLVIRAFCIHSTYETGRAAQFGNDRQFQLLVVRISNIVGRSALKSGIIVTAEDPIPRKHGRGPTVPVIHLECSRNALWTFT